MKTFKIHLRDYQVETVQAENFAIDEQNNLVVGNNLFHASDWKRILFVYDSVSDNSYYHDPNTFEPISQSPSYASGPVNF